MRFLIAVFTSLLMLTSPVLTLADPDDRQDRRDCRQDEGYVGKDKRDCKQEEVRDGVRGKQGERFDDDDDDD